jgi:hypothetical protein
MKKIKTAARLAAEQLESYPVGTLDDLADRISVLVECAFAMRGEVHFRITQAVINEVGLLNKINYSAIAPPDLELYFTDAGYTTLLTGPGNSVLRVTNPL